MAWLPSTAVGDGDVPGEEDGDREAAADVALATGEVVADADGATDGGVEDADAAVVEVGGALFVAVAVGFAKLGDGLKLACVAGGRSASDPVDDAANTAAPSAARPRIAMIGISATRLPRGWGVRQLGQKPETGVNTLPQFRHRIGRRSRAMACLAAFSMRDRF